MGAMIRARVRSGVLEPLEKLDLPEGKEVIVTINRVAEAPDVEAFRRSAGGWRGLIDADKLIENIYADRLIATRPEPRL